MKAMKLKFTTIIRYTNHRNLLKKVYPERKSQQHPSSRFESMFHTFAFGTRGGLGRIFGKQNNFR